MKPVYIILKLIVHCWDFRVLASDPPTISLFITFSFLSPLKKITNEFLCLWSCSAMFPYVMGAGRSSWDTGCNGGRLGREPGGFVTVRQLLIPLADGWLTFWNKILREAGERRKRRSMGRRHLKDWKSRNELSAPRFKENFIIGHRSVVSFQLGSQRPSLRGIMQVFLTFFWPYQANCVHEKRQVNISYKNWAATYTDIKGQPFLEC